MPARRKDFTGQRIGRLTVLSFLGKINTRSVFRCRCDCGEIAIVRGAYLGRAAKGNGGTQSCGCQKFEAAMKNMKGFSK
jgi:hypothetical protein